MILHSDGQPESHFNVWLIIMYAFSFLNQYLHQFTQSFVSYYKAFFHLFSYCIAFGIFIISFTHLSYFFPFFSVLFFLTVQRIWIRRNLTWWFCVSAVIWWWCFPHHASSAPGSYTPASPDSAGMSPSSAATAAQGSVQTMFTLHPVL